MARTSTGCKKSLTLNISPDWLCEVSWLSGYGWEWLRFVGSCGAAKLGRFRDPAKAEISLRFLKKHPFDLLNF
jgi:hypothetical protein